MKHTTLLAAGALALSLSQANAAVGMLADTSFEGTLTFDGPPFVSTWEGFSGGGDGTISSAAFTAANPNTGVQSLELTFTGIDAFAGLFQDIAGVIPGNSYTWSGLHAGAAIPGPTAEQRIEWYDAGGGGLGSTPASLNTPVSGTAYAPFSLTGTAPAGAETARFVYSAITFGAPTGTIYVDDVSVTGTFVPEPTTPLLGAIGLLGFLLRRRR